MTLAPLFHAEVLQAIQEKSQIVSNHIILGNLRIQQLNILWEIRAPIFLQVWKFEN